PYEQAATAATFIRNYTAGMHDAARVLIHPVAYLHNSTRSSIQTLTSADWDRDRKVFAGDAASEDDLVAALQFWLSASTPGRAAGRRLLEASYEQAPELLEVAGEILTDPGRYPMTEEQREAFDKVLHAVQEALSPTSDRNDAIIVITGGPGTGKTWIAMHLVGANAQAGRQVSYATNSSSLRSALAKRAREGLRLLDRPVDALITSARTYWDEKEWVTPRDVLIVDEAHRLTEYTVRTGHANARAVQHGSRNGGSRSCSS
ncbi:MAG: DUF2075 domain-containing protein, partial [Actinomycetota bacterium]|nr:DUF2075 domain-containing protein [Actinomycetota bacterium]